MKGKPFTMDRAPIGRPRGVLPRAIVTLVRITPRNQSEGGGGGGEERIFRGSHMVLWGNGDRTRRRQHSIKRGQFFISYKNLFYKKVQAEIRQNFQKHT